MYYLPPSLSLRHTYIDAASPRCGCVDECSMSLKWRNLCHTRHKRVATMSNSLVYMAQRERTMWLTFSPVCVLKCLRSRLGRSNALPQYSHGSMVRSLGFLTTMCVERVFFMASMSFNEMLVVCLSSSTITSSSSSSSLFTSPSSSWRNPSRLAESGELGALSTWQVIVSGVYLVTDDDLRLLLPVTLAFGVGLAFLLRSREYSSDENSEDGRRFSFWDENDDELEMDEVDSDGEASRDIDKSSGLSVGSRQ